jgi:hypothetical protein
MSYIIFDTQCAFFQTLRERRRNREIYGATIHPCFSSFLFFDPCLDMISCHHPDIWEYGTGNLLVAPKPSIISTNAENRALQWRDEAINLKNNNIEKGFGYLARKTLEYRDSMRMYKYELEATSTVLSDEHIERFEYIENICYQIEDIGLKSEKTRRVGIQRHGILFDKDRYLSRYQKDFQIYNEIDECIRNPRPVFLGIELLFYPETEIQREDDILMYENIVYNYDDIYYENIYNYNIYNYDNVYNYDNDESSEDEDESHYPVTVPIEFILSSQKQECVVCLEEKDVLEWPCHTTHVTCEECVLKIVRFRQVSCPICRKNL